MAVKLLAPAKINLVLRVLARRLDGYHELFTVFQKVTLFDELELSLTKTPEIKIEILGASLPTDERNLCVQAALLYREKTGLEFGLKIRLKKIIPSGSGLGGGSSDAAAVLSYLNEKFALLTQEELFSLAKALGADVPFFLFPGSTALGRGIGERLSPWPTHPAYYVLVVPRLSISTAWAYRNLRLTIPAEPPNYVPGQPLWHQGLVNDFEPLIFEFYPELKGLKQKLKELGAREALLSGTGASLFGVFERRQQAEKAMESLRGKNLNVFLATNYIP